MNDLEHNTAFCALVLSLNWFMGLVASVFIDQSNCFLVSNRFIRCPTHLLPVLERRFANCILTAFLLNEKCSYQFKNLWMVRV